MESNVVEILGKANLKIKKTRVAAYCRVSSRKEEQEYSYETQVNHYFNMIQSNPYYELVQIFGDWARSGTNTRRRPEFNRMIKMCELGQIDLIVTKSISRFARNAITTLETVNKLRNLGVVIYFEKEDIRTDDTTFDLFLTVYSSYAEQEAVSNSKNRIWQIDADMRNGKFKNTYLYGYHCFGDGRLEINEEQATWVRYIFTRYASGGLIANIIDELEQKGIKSPIGKERWNRTTIKEMLRNEKYTGDALLHKTFTQKVGSRINTRNRGERTRFYVENDHEPIISHELFDKVQAIFEQRRKKLNMPLGRVSNPPHPFSHFIYSLQHDAFLSRKVTHKGKPYESYSYQFTGKTDNFIQIFQEHIDMLFDEVLKSLQKDTPTLKTRIDDFIKSRYESTNIESKILELEERVGLIEDRKNAILELPIDDEKKSELVSGIDGEISQITNDLARYKSRKVMEYTTNDELVIKCRELKKEIKSSEYELIRTIFDTVIVDGKERMWVILKATNESINENIMKQYTLVDPFLTGTFKYKRPKTKEVKTKWNLVII